MTFVECFCVDKGDPLYINTLKLLFKLKPVLYFLYLWAAFEVFLRVFVQPEELLAYEAKLKDAEEHMQAPPEPVKARIPFTACLQALTEPENVPDFWSSALQAKSAGVK